MSLAATAVKRQVLTTFATIVFLIAGLVSYFQLGQLEDPEFTVKTAVVTATYPGATAAEVELEVTDRIEQAIQEMVQVKEIESFSRPGFSLVKVDILPQYMSDDLPQVWDELRKKIRDIESQLPPGAGTPEVSDDFGDVYGFLMAVVADGFSYAELEGYVDHLKKELSLIQGVSRVELWGIQAQCIYVEIVEARLSQLGLSFDDLQRTFQQQNLVVHGGGVEVGTERLRIETTGEFTDPEDIADLVVRGRQLGNEDNSRLLRIRDIATIRRGYVEPPATEMRHNGRPAYGLAISNLSGVNIVNLGRAIDVRLAEIEADLPAGIEIRRISWQSDLVRQSIVDFMINLIEAVAIVLIVLWVAMGFRTAMIVGLTGLVFTIIVTFVFMSVMGIDLQRMSLGALVIAMGMMVDNAIVVIDGILVRLRQGRSRVDAAVEAASQPAIPLLGATIIAVMAFYPIYSSTEAAGEYCATLFSVVAISLMVSWVLAVTITPIMCIALLPTPKSTGDSEDIYGGRMYRAFRGALEKAIRWRLLVLIVFLGGLVGSLVGFRWVDQSFFPASARAQFMVDYWAPEGTQIQKVSAELRRLEAQALADPRVESVSTFIGQGPPRFYLPVDPENPYASYGQLIVNVPDYRSVQELIPSIQAWADENLSEAEIITRKYGLGPYETWPVEARFSGPAIADPDVLRSLANQAVAIMQQSPQAQIVNTNWRQRVKKVVADFDETNARWTSVSRQDIGDATRRAYDGLPVGLYREDDKLLPIMLRHPQAERQQFAGSMSVLQIRPPLASESVPLSQVTTSIGVEWEDPMIWRWDRRRAITVQGVPRSLAALLRDDVIDGIEAIELPPGYELEWDGEYRSSRDAQQSLIPGIVPAAIIVALIVVGLFNAYRPPMIIVCVIPFAMIGITIGLLLTGQPFGFVALLGAMSLAGMMIKNAIVLLDQVNIEKAAGKGDYQAILDSAVSRLRPVILAAATTVLGVMPLLQDVFWIAMAVTIMFGLAFGTVLTMILIPVLYALFFRLRPEKATA